MVGLTELGCKSESFRKPAPRRLPGNKKISALVSEYLCHSTCNEDIKKVNENSAIDLKWY